MNTELGTGVPALPLIRSIVLFGILLLIIECAFPSSLSLFVKRLPQRIVHRLHILRLRIQSLTISFQLRIAEIRLSIGHAIIICLKRGYFSGNKSNLGPYRVLCGVCVNHPVEVINIFLECFHTYWMRVIPNDKDQARREKEKP